MNPIKKLLLRQLMKLAQIIVQIVLKRWHKSLN